MGKDEIDEIKQIPSNSPDFHTELAKQLQKLVPEAITDGKVDTKKLKELLDDDSADDSERFGLFWPGKKRAIRAAQEPTTATLKPAKEESKDWDTTENLYIEGDNLEVLKILQKHYHNKIKVIYIDPPYNTGHDFVYPDNYKEGLQSYLEFTKQVDEEGRKISTNSDTDGRYHSNWLNMMYPRLKLARNLLTNDGVIFISIGENENDNLRKICAEIFGESNYVGQIIVISNPRGSQEPHGISSVHEYILCYTRSVNGMSSINGISREDESEFSFITDHGDKARLLGLRKRGGDWKRADRPNMFYPFYVNPVNLKVSLSQDSEYTVEVFPCRPTGEESRWTWGKDTSEKQINTLVAKQIKRDNTVEYDIYRIDPLNDQEGNSKLQKLKSVWDEKEFNYQNARGTIKDLFNNSEIFDFPKPVELIMKILGSLDSKNYLVLDYFSGSATTAHAVMLLNAQDGGSRTNIQVQLPEPTNSKSEAFKAGYKTIADIARERIRRAGEKIKIDLHDNLKSREIPLDIGFKVYKLSDSNFSKWDTSSDINKELVQQKLLSMKDSTANNSSQEDIITEILLKLGLPLTSKISKVSIDGLELWDVNKLLLAYLDEKNKPTLAQLRSVVEKDLVKFVILEDCLAGDDELKTNLSQICKTKGIELWTL